jgi:hypothetical protein
MKQTTIKNYRFMRFAGEGDLYDQVKSDQLIIEVSDGHRSIVYFGNGQIKNDPVAVLRSEDIVDLANAIECPPRVLLDLIIYLNSGEEVFRQNLLDAHGGELILFDLKENVDIIETVEAYEGFIGLLKSIGTMSIQDFDASGVVVDGKLLSFQELMGNYDEDEEVLLIYEN